jgi:ABC-type multidrug transport system ATPase subunit
MPGHSVIARNLPKRYGDTVALDDISFRGGRGEIFAFLGANGSGITMSARVPVTDVMIRRARA